MDLSRYYISLRHPRQIIGQKLLFWPYRAFLVFGCGSTIRGEIRGLPSISKEEEEKGERDKMQIKSR